MNHLNLIDDSTEQPSDKVEFETEINMYEWNEIGDSFKKFTLLQYEPTIVQGYTNLVDNNA